MIKQISALLSLVFMFQFYVCQNKHALIIAIGNYPDKWQNNWTDISSLNDVGLIKNMLKEQKFDSSNTTILTDQSATVNNIENALEELILKAKKEDIIYIHYSGHGQQVPDLEKSKNKYLYKDEQDGWDEALVTYNAPAKFEEKPGYNYEHHFIDDEFNYYVNRLREKTGKNGQIIVVLDACHSGTGTRGSNELGKARGTSIPCAPKGYIPKINHEASKNKYTENDFNYSPNLNLGALTVFSGCKSDQVNRECEDDNGTPYG